MPTSKAPEAFSRVVIDAQLRDAAWNLTDGRSVRFEYVLPDGTKADYVLCDRHGRTLAAVEAKRMAIDPRGAEKQARDYAAQLGVPFVFLANGNEIWFWDCQREAHPHQVRTFFSQDDLERRSAARATRKDLMAVPTDTRIAGDSRHSYQRDCIDTICREIAFGRRRMLVEMATGTGKTRTAAALIKRLFDAGVVTRVLFLVDRIPLARQTEDAFAQHLLDLPAYVLRAGRRFQDEKRITITTLQSMVNEYGKYSSGYFDLVISDECHRSIYGKWSGVLKHFDGIQIGLTATPRVASPEVLESLEDEEDRAFVRDTLRFFGLDRPTFRYTLKQAISERVLVPYRIYKALTVKTAAEGGFPVHRSELDWSAMDAETRTELEALFAKGGAPIIVDPNALERRFTIPERNRAIVREFRDVILNGYTGKDGVRRFPHDGKTIVFAVTKRHATTLAQMFDDAFADRKPAPEIRYADFVVSGSGADDTANAADKIARFKKEALPAIIVSVNMLDTGFDAPEVVNLVMARFTRSAILYQQMRGRGTRRADSIKKTSFTIFDFVGVTDYHGDAEDIPADGGFVVTAERAKDKGKARGLLLLDVNDHIDPTTRGWVTLDENGNEVRTPAADTRAAELGIRFEAWLLAQDGLTPDQVRLLRMLGEVITANAGDLESVEPYHFAMPPFTGMGGRRMAEATFGGTAALGAVLTSLNAAVFPPAEPGAPQAEAPHPPA